MSDIRATAKRSVENKFNYMIALACKAYPQVADKIRTCELSFRTFGKSAGKAEMSYKTNRRTGEKSDIKLLVRINIGMMVLNEKNWNHVLNETVSHEVAHIVDYCLRGVSGHDAQWVAIHKALGGSGKQYHNCDLARGTRYEYVVNGAIVHLTGKQHEQVTGRSSWKNVLTYKGTKIEARMFKKEVVQNTLEKAPFLVI